MKNYYMISINSEEFALHFWIRVKCLSLRVCLYGVGFAPFLRFVYIFTCFPLCLKMIIPTSSAYGAE